MTDEFVNPPQAPDLHMEKRRGMEAKHILDSEVFNETLTKMRDRVQETFRACPVRDTDGMMYLRIYMDVIDKFEEAFKETAITGRMAEMQLDKQYDQEIEDQKVRSQINSIKRNA